MLPSNFKEWFLDIIGPATDVGLAIASSGGSLVWTALNEFVDALLQPQFIEVLDKDVMTDSMIKRIEQDPKVVKARKELDQAINQYNSTNNVIKDPIMMKDDPLVTLLTLGLFSNKRNKRKAFEKAKDNLEEKSKLHLEAQQKVASTAQNEVRDVMGLIKL